MPEGISILSLEDDEVRSKSMRKAAELTDRIITEIALLNLRLRAMRGALVPVTEANELALKQLNRRFTGDIVQTQIRARVAEVVVLAEGQQTLFDHIESLHRYVNEMKQLLG
ncbi:MAG: hypothetical protein JWM91_499 [Rhodospirillales bacterium]|nr:hypothetical protein [Rhodospirillales bacterium]